MTALEKFNDSLTPAEHELLEQLTGPREIQEFLDTLPYSTEPVYRCPLSVLHDRLAHCFDGALFAAMALRRIGHPPLILDMIPNGRDDDHLLALFKRHNCWGAVAKSNFVGLRYREPIHRTLRELVLSYFEQYYNVAGEKTLRGYTQPLNLTAFDHLDWLSKNDGLEAIAEKLDHLRKFTLLTPEMEAELSPVDSRARQAGLLGANEAGLFKPA